MRRHALRLSLLAVAPVLTYAQTPAFAGGFNGPARGDVERVIDGDTVKIRVGVWIDQEIIVSVRVAGVDAPELFRPKCAAEKEKALFAKLFVENFLDAGVIILQDIKHDKYAGRVVARIESDGRDLGRALVKAGHAVDGHKGVWC